MQLARYHPADLARVRLYQAHLRLERFERRKITAADELRYDQAEIKRARRAVRRAREVAAGGWGVAA